MKNEMTVAALIAHLQMYSPETQCVASLWFAEDFLEMDGGLSPVQIEHAMQSVKRGHDASIGINWEVLAVAVENSTEYGVKVF